MPKYTDIPKAPKVPCGTCPYRKDVPSGVWAEAEYSKLPQYDGDMTEQAMQGGTALFMCHQKDGCLCGGWLKTHGVHNLIALRLRQVDPSVFDYDPPTEVFASGAEAYLHGIAHIDDPQPEALKKIQGLLKKRRNSQRA